MAHKCHANVNADANGIYAEIYLFPLLRGRNSTCQHMSNSAEYILRYVESYICHWSGPNYRISAENQQISFNTPHGLTWKSSDCLWHGWGWRSKPMTPLKKWFSTFSVTEATYADSWSDMAQPCDMDLWHMKWRSAWPTFHGQVILPSMLKTIWFMYMYIILWEYESVWPDVWPQN